MNRIVQDERWYDKSSLPYFTSDLTRNAQTISFKQRHRPVFQMYVDLQTGIILGFLTIMSTILTIRNNSVQEQGLDFGKVFIAQEEKIVETIFFLMKFLILVLLYRCSEDGNILEKTGMFWQIRQVFDMMLYFFIGYVIYISYQLDGIKCPDGDEGASISVAPSGTGRVIV